MLQKNWAKMLTRWGYSVFPIEPDGKIPLLPWKTESTASTSQAEDWWSTFPDDNIGINTGESNLLVIDIDSEDAFDTWDELWFYRDQDTDWWTSGSWPIVETRRGWHVYFDAGKDRYRNTAGKLGPGLDSRGHGGMVLAPGSVVRGVEYRCIKGGMHAWEQPGPVPGWLRRMLIKPPTLSQDSRKSVMFKQPSKFKSERELARWCSRIENAPDGEQNTTINAAAYILSRDYTPPLELENVRGELLAAAERGNHPMQRARATIESGLIAHE